MKEFYNLLGVPEDADQRTIQQAYRKLSRTMHPDHGGDVLTWQKITEAYNVLKNPDKRAAYDAGGNGTNSIEEQALAKVRNLFMQNLQGFDLQFEDPLAAVREHVTREMREMRGNLTSMEKKIGQLAQVTVKGPTDRFQNLIIGMIEEGQKVIKRIHSAIELNEIAVKLCQDYSWESLIPKPAPEPEESVFQIHFGNMPPPRFPGLRRTGG